MFSRPLAFVLLALGCVTAAAGGAYLATRHNAAESHDHGGPRRPLAAATPGSTVGSAGQRARSRKPKPSVSSAISVHRRRVESRAKTDPAPAPVAAAAGSRRPEARGFGARAGAAPRPERAVRSRDGPLNGAGVAGQPAARTAGGRPSRRLLPPAPAAGAGQARGAAARAAARAAVRGSDPALVLGDRPAAGNVAVVGARAPRRSRRSAGLARRHGGGARGDSRGRARDRQRHRDRQGAAR